MRLCNQIILIFLFLLTQSNAAPTTPQNSSQNNTEILTVENAIEIALSRNLDFKSQTIGLQLAEMAFKDAWDRMYLPKVDLTFNTTSSYTLGTLPNTPARKIGAQQYNRGYPTSAAGITLGTYTLFNFFRDKISYDLARLNYERSQEVFVENKRALKHKVETAYFKAKIDQDKLDAAQRSFEISRAIYQLKESQKKLGKTTTEEVSSSEVDMINAKIAVDSVEKNNYSSILALNLLINAKPDQRFKLTSILTVARIRLTPQEAFTIFKQSAPAQKASILSLRAAETNTEIAEKSRLPLPTVTFNGVSVTYGNNYAGGSSTVGGSTPAGQMNIEASVGVTVPLVGPGGLLNSRAVASAHMAQDQAEISATQTLIGAEIELSRRIDSLKKTESLVEDLKKTFSNSARLLNSLFSKVGSSSSNRLEIRDAILQARTSEASYLDAQLQYLSDKNDLAEYIGVADFREDLKK